MDRNYDVVLWVGQDTSNMYEVQVNYIKSKADQATSTFIKIYEEMDGKKKMQNDEETIEKLQSVM